MIQPNDYVFISYSRRDKSHVLRFIEQLQVNGVAVWIDEKDIPVSVPWQEEISDAIRGAAAVLSFDSLQSLSSPACEAELAAAARLGVPVLHVDPDTSSPDECSAMVSSYLSRRGPESRLRTDLLVRAGVWQTSARSSGNLVGGQGLKRFRLLAARDKTLPNEAFEYLEVCRRRQHRKSALAVTGIVTTILAITTVQVFTGAGVQGVDSRVEAINSLTTITERREIAEHNLYAGMDVLSTLPSEGGAAAADVTTTLAQIVPIDVKDGPPPLVESGPAVPAELSALAAQATCAATSGELVVLCEQGTGHLVLFQMSNQELIRRVSVPGEPRFVDFSPDERTLAVATGNEVVLVPVSGLGTPTRLRGSIGAVELTGFSPDGRTVWGHTAEGRNVTWETPGGSSVFDDASFWTMDSIFVTSLDSAAVAARDGRILLVNSTGEAKESWRVTGIPTALATSDAEPVLAITHVQDDAASVTTYDFITGDAETYPVHSCQPFDLFLAEESIYVACDSGLIRVNRETSAQETVAFDGESLHAVTATAEHLVVGTSLGQIMKVDGNAVTPLADGCLSGSDQLTPTPDGQYLFNAGATARTPSCAARLTVDDDANWERHSLVLGSGEADQARALAASPDSKLIAYGFADGSIRVLFADTLEPVADLNGFGAEVRGLSFLNGGRVLLVATRDGRIATVQLEEAYLSLADRKNLLGDRVERAIDLGLYKPAL